MADPAPFDFRSLQPAQPLGRWVESLWYARGTVPYTRERIAPTGSTVVVFVLGDPILEIANDGDGEAVSTAFGFMVGPHDRPVVNQPEGETIAVGVVCTPIGAKPALGLDPALFRGRVVELAETWPRAVSLRQQFAAEPDPDVMLEIVESELSTQLLEPITGVDRVERTVALLDADPTRSIGEIADGVGVSHAHLVREFTAIVGMTPRSLARLLRMRRLLAGLDVDDAVGWAALAVELGWYDQAHLIRDFKRHTGVTPTQYLAAQRSLARPVDAVDAAGFVPEF